MSNYNYKLRLQALRQTTILVGVVGMAASGKTEFEKVVIEKGYPIFTYDYEGIMEDTLLPESELQYLPATRRAEVAAMDNDELIAAMLQDMQLYTVAKNAMFDIHMNVVANKIRDAFATSPTIKDEPIIFVECPISTKIKYNDMFDAVITISRPKTYGDSWWVDYYADGMSDKHSKADSVNSLKYNDVMFNQMQFTEVVNINNDQDSATFIERCESTIDDVVEVLQSR